MLRPKQTKFKKFRKGKIKQISSSPCQIKFGSFGLKSLEAGRITARQIEATRRAITRRLKRSGKVWVRIFPDRPITSKPTEIRMGKGKGAVDFWVCPISAGAILYEIEGVSKELAKSAFSAGSSKLPVLTKIIIL
jgi:large subunit ribosomal protein L16